MAVDKFKFVSPGVFIDEIDESGVPALPERMGPLVIGRFQKGPSNRPTKVESFKEFGYKTSTAFADLPMEKSIERAIARYYGESGRFVDPIYIVTHGNKNINTFEELKKLVDSWSIYNTDVPINTQALFVDGFP